MAKIQMSRTAARALAERDVLKGQPKRTALDFTNYGTFSAYSRRFDVITKVQTELGQQLKGAAAADKAFRQVFGLDVPAAKGGGHA